MNIAIKVPNNLDEKLLSFPFLHALSRYFDAHLEDLEDEVLNIHIISNKKNIEVLNLLPFSAYYHALEEDDLKNIFTIHRGVGNLNLQNIDYFFSTTKTLVDALIGKNLKSTKKIGFAGGKSSLLFTDKIECPGDLHYSQQVFSLMDSFKDNKVRIKKVVSRKVDPLVPDWNEVPYSVFNLELTKDEINPEWIELFDLFEGQTFYFTCDQADINTQRSHLIDFIKKLPKKNTYHFTEIEDLVEFSKLVAYAKAFISCDSDLVGLASYLGAQCFHISRKKDVSMDNRYFLGDTVVCSLSDPYYKDGKDFNYGKIFDEILEYLKTNESGAI